MSKTHVPTSRLVLEGKWELEEVNNSGWMCFCLLRLDGLNHQCHEYAMRSASLRITSRLEVLLQTLLRPREFSSDLGDAPASGCLEAHKAKRRAGCVQVGLLLRQHPSAVTHRRTVAHSPVLHSRQPLAQRLRLRYDDPHPSMFTSKGQTSQPLADRRPINQSRQTDFCRLRDG